uniref:CSON011448 protein n=1 Tax=Culicoides sonorensis TaxID=179676 RepID=A0A336LKB5_CULSO
MLHLSLLWIIILFMLIVIDIKKPKNFPLGPKWLPILGSMFCKAIEQIASQYQNNKGLLGLKIGKDRIVLAISNESLREMMLNEDLDGRPTGPFYETRTWNLRRGVLLTDGEFWQEQRRFIVKHLKEFGFARRGMFDIIQNEAEYLFKDIFNMVERANGKVLTDMQGLFSTPVLNTLWVMMAGKRYSRENKTLKELQKLLHQLFTSIDMVGCLFSHFPFLRYLAPHSSGYRPFLETHEHMYDFIRKEVENHKRNFQIESEPRDLMDVYIKIILVEKQLNTFSEQQLLAVCLELQSRIQKELDATIGRERLPRLEDRPNLPFCEAVVLEALRVFMANTLGVAHRALRPTKLCGFDIPKDTMLVGLYRGMMMDSNLWKNPADFDPDRFIQNGRVVIPNEFYPFGLGKHRCMGEMLARSNVFLFITTILQNFCISIPAGHPMPSDEPIDGATPSVRNYKVVISHRPEC